MQCEILQHENLGASPPDEEPVPPPPEDMGLPLYDFFGLGQHVLAPIAEHDQQLLHNQGLLGNNQNVKGEQDNLEEGNQLVDWPDWPEELPAQAHARGPQLNLNVAPLVVGQDLNAPAPLAIQDLNMALIDEDPQEVIVHPGQGQEQEKSN